MSETNVTKTDARLVNLLTQAVQAQVSKGKTWTVGHKGLAALLGVAAMSSIGWGGYHYLTKDSGTAVTAEQVAKHDAELVKVIFTSAGGIKSRDRVVLNNFTVPQGTSFKDRVWQTGDLSVVIEKSHPLYASFSGTKMKTNQSVEKIAGGSTYEVTGISTKYNGHPQVVVKEMKPKS